VRIEGGSFGLQLGGSSTDVIMLVLNEGGMKKLLSDKSFAVGRMKSALLAIKSKISAHQMSMLRAHYIHRMLSMRQIAALGGYGNYRLATRSMGRSVGRSPANSVLHLRVTRRTPLLQLPLNEMERASISGGWMMW
jgi:hypothetical protein